MDALNNNDEFIKDEEEDVEASNNNDELINDEEDDMEASSDISSSPDDHMNTDLDSD
ncbi:MAG: hypothetical protein Q8835_02860 [Sweet potato little leaf phytoplasma]|nr:hypothetical protein [Sweet potato little leaf phytoplasma]